MLIDILETFLDLILKYVYNFFSTKNGNNVIIKLISKSQFGSSTSSAIKSPFNFFVQVVYIYDNIAQIIKP